MQREYPEHPLIGVGVVILRVRGESAEVLLIRRDKPPRQGQWSLPGGAQKLGETVMQTGIREIREETGLEIKVLGLIDVVDSIIADDEDSATIRYHYTLIDLLAQEVAGGTLKAASDASDAAWMALDDIPGLGLWSETERIINLAAEMRDALGAAGNS